MAKLQTYEMEERAAILEYDAGMTRDQAEMEAIRTAEEQQASNKLNEQTAK